MSDTVMQDSWRLLEHIICLKKSALFSTVETFELRAIAAVAQECIFSPGEVVVRENDIGDSLYLIKSGTVTVSRADEAGTTVELATMGAGECFGEMSVIDAEVRSASVTAKTACVLLCLSRDNLMDVVMDYPTIAVELLRMFVKRLRAANAAIQRSVSKQA